MGHNGLVGIVLPSAEKKPIPPDRLRMNLKGANSDEGYARWYYYPTRKDQLANILDDAFQARTSRADLIENPRDNFKYNKSCPWDREIMPKLKDVKVSLKIPYIGGIEGTWTPDKAEQEAAWENSK